MYTGLTSSRETTNAIRKGHIPIEEFETLATKALMTSPKIF